MAAWGAFEGVAFVWHDIKAAPDALRAFKRDAAAGHCIPHLRDYKGILRGDFACGMEDVSLVELKDFVCAFSLADFQPTEVLHGDTWDDCYFLAAFFVHKFDV